MRCSHCRMLPFDQRAYRIESNDAFRTAEGPGGEDPDEFQKNFERRLACASSQIKQHQFGFAFRADL